ncbi:bifunctional 5,10-methylenetetrahydrofolate dehydrogenase/5,10-methenyltetrahydrofolate cyclohydrolase [Patescibacteria group bacterium]|nr:MAG: bifunctional 5,10-methylenetetrahydrofolate dehydrogenase/5,10-methenyltetrahydrofolate cyclohydrolase [Patescibacteria group bacterium]
MKLLKGRPIADKILADLKRRIAKSQRAPALAAVLVGNNKASELYVSLKQKAAGEIGMDFWVLSFSAQDSEKDVLQAIKDLNRDRDIHGIIVQLPLPKKFDTQKIVNAVDPRKDVDGFHWQNIQLFVKGKNKVVPAFPQAILQLIESDKRELAGKRGVGVVNSQMFGEMMVKTLQRKKIKAEYVLSSNIKYQISKLKEADIVITAIGKPGIIRGKMLKKGVVVIDGGVSKIGQRVVGDIDLKSVSKVARAISPVPGGVGPMTIACLLQNVYLAFKKQTRG